MKGRARMGDRCNESFPCREISYNDLLFARVYDDSERKADSSGPASRFVYVCIMCDCAIMRA